MNYPTKRVKLQKKYFRITMRTVENYMKTRIPSFELILDITKGTDHCRTYIYIGDKRIVLDLRISDATMKSQSYYIHLITKTFLQSV